MRIRAANPTVLSVPPGGSFVEMIKSQEPPEIMLIIFDDTSSQYDVGLSVDSLSREIIRRSCFHFALSSVRSEAFHASERRPHPDGDGEV